MPNLGFGILSSGHPALRIGRDNATNLRTELATNFSKFLFDSETGKLGYVYNIDTEPYDNRWTSGGYLGTWWGFSPGDKNGGSTSIGSTTSRVLRWSKGFTSNGVTYGNGQEIYQFSNWWPFGYLPIYETRTPFGTNLDTFSGPTLYNTVLPSGIGYIYSFNGYQGDTVSLYDTNTGQQDRAAYYVSIREAGDVANKPAVCSVFQLPARNVAMPNFATTPVSGQKSLLLNPTTVRLALPGRTVTSTNPDHYIFHENKIPAKIMAAGDINVALGGTATINCPLPLTKLTYMDFHVKHQTDAEFWNPPYFTSDDQNQVQSFTYQVLTQSILITNTSNYAITIRYMIFADSEQAPTTGGKKVFLKGNDGVRDYVQIKRPGSSDIAPNLNDIIIDTRLSYVPILAEGFLNWNTTDFPSAMSGGGLFLGERQATVNFTNPLPRLLPFVKQYVVFPESAKITSRASYHRVFTTLSGSWTNRTSGDSSWANLHNTSVDFYMAGDNPLNISPGGPQWNVDQNGTARSAIGLRYYIFGIPANF